jgi:hypothetical protein
MLARDYFNPQCCIDSSFVEPTLPVLSLIFQSYANVLKLTSIGMIQSW